MNRIRASLLLAGTVVSLVACHNQDDTASEPDESIERQKEEIYGSAHANDHYLSQVERAEPNWAGVSYASHTWVISSDYVAEITDRDSLEFIIENMIEGSQRQPGVVAMPQPYYDIHIEYSDGSDELFHLWVSEENTTGTIMDTENTHFIYTFSDDVSERFLSLLPEDAVLDAPVHAEWIDGNTFGLTQSVVPSLESNINTLITNSDYIVQGIYLSSEPSDVPESWVDENESFEYFSFEVSTVLKGDLDQEAIDVGHPEYIITWVRDPESGEDLGTVSSKDPFMSQPDPEKEVILFLSMQNEPGEFWRFSEPTMVEVIDDGSLESMSAAFDPDFDISDRVEHHDLEGGWEVELTLSFPSGDLPADDPFESLSLDDLLDMIN